MKPRPADALALLILAVGAAIMRRRWGWWRT